MRLPSYVGYSETKVDVLGKDPSLKNGYSYHLFVHTPDPEKERFDGIPIGVSGAVQSYNADDVFPLSLFQ